MSLDELRIRLNDTITDLRSKLSLPESTLQVFIASSEQLVNNYQRYSLGKIRHFLLQKNIPENDADVANLAESLQLVNPFSDVKTYEDNMSYLAFRANGSIPVPRELVFARRKITRLVPRTPGVSSRKTKIIKEVAHYIPIHETIQLIMRNPEAQSSVLSEKSADDLFLRGFKDGLNFKTESYFQRHPFALRIIIHIDEVEYLNPLASRKGKKKLTNVSFKIQNFDPIINSSLSRVYLTLAVQSSELKKYGYKQVLGELLKDLKTLEDDAGITMTLDNGTLYTFHAVVVNVAGDTAALHEIFEIIGPQSKLFCRVCYITRNELRSGTFGNDFPYRTTESIQSDLTAVQNNKKTPAECGLVRECCLHDLSFFNYGRIRSMDPMHDLCEGVNMMVIKLIFYDMVVVQKLLTCEDINEMIEDFEYGSVESVNKPSANFSLKNLKAKGNAISQSASQCWLLLRVLPFIFGHLISFNLNYTRIISVLLKINYFTFSSIISSIQIDELQNDIATFYKLFKICFRDVNPINKIHHLSHYPEIFRMNGTITNCFIFEGKFKESKSQSKTCNNFRNLTFSITKRTNLKQIQSIISHCYDLNVHKITSYVIVSKLELPYANSIQDLPEKISLITNLSINGTRFRTGCIVEYKTNSTKYFGIFVSAFFIQNTYFCIIQKLDVLEFDINANSLKIQILDEMIRIESSLLLTKKTYNLWKYYPYNSEYAYISLKYINH